MLIPLWLVGAVPLYTTVTAFSRGARTETFSSTTGEITRVDVETTTNDEDGTTHVPKLTYRYVAGGRTHESDRIVAGTSSLPADEAGHWKARYPAGTRVRVYFDERAPETATLVPGVASETYGIALFTAMWLMMLMGFSSFTWACRLGVTHEGIVTLSRP